MRGELRRSGIIFDYPKPVQLIKYLLEIGCEPNDGIVMDFFAGSGTLGHAVYLQNLESDGERNFILVQLPEATPSDSAARAAGYDSISQITVKRLRITSKELDVGKKEDSDVGFRVLKLHRSNFVKWRSETAKTNEDLERTQGQLALGGTLVPGWKLENVLTEIMLINAFPLDSSIEQSPDFFENRVDIITHPERGSRLLVCLDRDPLGDSTVAAVRDEKYQKDVFVCLETALTDQIKARLADSIRIKTL
jgi:adenine-specific DNA-methyltransferase